MTDEEQQQLIDDHFLFDKPVSTLLTCAGMARDWPDARGIFHNHNKDFLVWVNEEDHTRVIAMEKGGNMKKVFERFARGLGEVHFFQDDFLVCIFSTVPAHVLILIRLKSHGEGGIYDMLPLGFRNF